MSEREEDFQRAITDLAEVCGWEWIHHRPARTSKGWRTPVEGSHARGFPDLVLVRDRVLFVEVKSERGRLSTAQRWWFERLHEAGQDVRVWRPSAWTEVVATLRRRV